MLRRWWPNCDIPIYLACDGDLKEYRDAYHIHIIEQDEDYGFVEGRIHALELLEEYPFVIMLQDDFIIERFVDNTLIHQLITIIANSYHTENPKIMDDSNAEDNSSQIPIACIRLMPCPGPKGNVHSFSINSSSSVLRLGEFEKNCWCRFSFQAAIWSRTYYIRFFKELKEDITSNIYKAYDKDMADAIISDPVYWKKIWFQSNLAENKYGCDFSLRYPERMLGVIRDGEYANAVYRSPIPYRPTAIVRGKVEEWAKELFKREKIDIKI
tara:strand:+ start:94 stop:900 length:807 start_codon:yes stop_codon:yes gene_type:complete